MTLAVADASIALKLFLAEDGSPEAEVLHKNYDWIAPDLVIPETLNALWKAFRRGLVGMDQAAQIAAAVAEPFSALVPAEELAEAAWNIATQLDHPAYDAFYVALAGRERCSLFTADERLCRKTRGNPYSEVVNLLRSPR